MTPQGERNQQRAFRHTAAAALALVIASGAFLGHSLYGSWQRHRDETTKNLQNVAFNLERNLLTTVQSADLLLQSAQQSYTRLSAHNSVERDTVSEVLQGLGGLLPASTDFRGANEQGAVVYGVGSDAKGTLSIAHRHYFYLARTAEGIVIGLPLRSRVSKRWVLPVARTLRKANGDFAGVAYVNLPLDSIQQSLTGLKLGEHGVASVFNQQAEIIARSIEVPRVKDEDGTFLVGSDMQFAVKEGRSNTPFLSRSGVDGIQRMSLYRQVGDYPLYVAVGLELAEMEAPWRRELLVASLSWLALCAAAAAYVYSQWRSDRQQRAIMAQLEAERRHSEEVARYKSMFLANISHEIRTPLNGVLGFAQVGYRLPCGTSEHQQAFMRILDAGTLLHGVLNDVLDMSKIEAGKLELHPEPTLLLPLVERMVGLVRKQSEDKGLALHLDVAGSMPPLLVVDGLRLEQILLNLLSNAVKFTERGRVSLEVHAQADSVVFTVKDSGVGMAHDQMDRLFRAFEQADGSTTRRFGGSGLGLTISKRLVDMMQGSIEVTSQLGIGSVFVVRLPFRSAGEVSAPPPPKGVAPVRMSSHGARQDRLQGMHVLVVEDNEVNQMVLVAMLQSEGATASVVGDGQQAVEWLRLHGKALPSAVLMDVQMPIMDGYEAARHIRSAHSGLPVIGQTAHALPVDRQKCLDAGMVDRLVKPLELEVLVQALVKYARRESHRSPG